MLFVAHTRNESILIVAVAAVGRFWYQSWLSMGYIRANISRANRRVRIYLAIANSLPTTPTHSKGLIGNERVEQNFRLCTKRVCSIRTQRGRLILEHCQTDHTSHRTKTHTRIHARADKQQSSFYGNKHHRAGAIPEDP